MLHESKRAGRLSSPARRHFMAIAIVAARRLSAVSIAASVVSGTDIRTAAADRGHGHGHGQRHDHGSWRGHGQPHGRGQGYAGVRCFGRGTLILTTGGEVPIDALPIGMPVVTMNGALPVKWIGRKTMRRSSSEAWHPGVVPVRVSRFAIDDRTPRRDLYVSQEHALFIDGALIPVKHLVNGRSIALDDSAAGSETIDYSHIEFDTHQVIFAEGRRPSRFCTAAEPSPGTIYAIIRSSMASIGSCRQLHRRIPMSASFPSCAGSPAWRRRDSSMSATPFRSPMIAWRRGRCRWPPESSGEHIVSGRRRPASVAGFDRTLAVVCAGAGATVT